MNRKIGVNQNWVQSETDLGRKADAKRKLEQAKLQEIGKKYIRIPHPILRNTYILRERK